MSRKLTASDRSALIRLASTLPAGSDERRAILSGLKRAYFSPDSSQGSQIESWIRKMEDWKGLYLKAKKAYKEMQRKHGLRGDGALVEAGLTGLAKENAGDWDYSLYRASELGLLDWDMKSDPDTMMVSIFDESFDSKLANAIKALDSLV